MLALTWIGLSFALLTSAPAEPPPLDAQVWNAQGQKVQLKSFWGKPTVLIYESRNATELNRALKDALWKRGHDPAARDVAQVLGVAALPDLDWFPAHMLAEHAVRERERKVGVPVLIDWKGVLTGGEWRLPAGTSSVLVLDGAGHVAFRASGALDGNQVKQVFSLLEQLTGHHG
ncbi:MAG TPA: YtfJ family protein [Myxococcaceae bacterium]|nr:YtfJ family protein [Myxococcaceae bacterium]